MMDEHKKNDIKNKICELSLMVDDPDSLKDGDMILSDLCIDSLSFIQLLFYAEKTLQINLSSEDSFFYNDLTVGEFFDVLDSK